VNKYVVITRPLEDSENFSKKIEGLGLKVFLYPTIEIGDNEIPDVFLENLKNSDWVVFTSRNGVKYFLEKAGKKLLSQKKIAAVGPKTRDELTINNLAVDFIPSKFTTKDLGEEIPINAGEKIFLPRANIASKALTEILEKRGAVVFNVPIYQTKLIAKRSKELEEMFLKKQISLITFTSPSTIEGFFRGFNDEKIKLKILDCPVLCIGPVTEKKAKEVGFKKVFVAESFTTDGMINKLSQMEYN